VGITAGSLAGVYVTINRVRTAARISATLEILSVTFISFITFITFITFIAVVLELYRLVMFLSKYNSSAAFTTQSTAVLLHRIDGVGSDLVCLPQGAQASSSRVDRNVC
jgi:Na+-transporting NADH:ubiquinone oxidoreductase subunit NqrE